MKGKTQRIILATVLALLLVGMVPAVALASATTQTQKVKIPVSGSTFTNPCNGETVTVTSGYLRLTDHVTQDANGGYHHAVEDNAQGVQGVDSSGTEYQITGGDWDEFNSNGATVTNGVSVFNLISHATSPNSIAEITIKYTVNDSGQLTATVDHINTKCGG